MATDAEFEAFLSGGAPPEPQKKLAIQGGVPDAEFDAFLSGGTPPAPTAAPVATPPAAQTGASDEEFEAFLAAPSRPPSQQAQAIRGKMDAEAGVPPEPPQAEPEQLPAGAGFVAKETAAKTGRDIGIPLAKGVVGLGQAALGAGQIGGLVARDTALRTMGIPEIARKPISKFLSQVSVGKLADKLGVDFATTHGFLDSFLSEGARNDRKAVRQARGFFRKVVTAAKRPRYVAQFGIESAPSSVAGGVVGRGLVGLFPKLSPLVAAAVGEGVVSAGSTAEQVREDTPGDTLTEGQAAIAATSGAATALLSLMGGKLAKRLGIDDVDVLIAGGATGDASKFSILRRIVQSALMEGAVEELPQSAQEQVAQNLATGRPAGEGVADATASGFMVGIGMGSVGAILGSQRGGTQQDAAATEGEATPPPIPQEAAPVEETAQPPPIPIQPGEAAPVTAERVAQLEERAQAERPVTAAEVAAAAAAGVPLARNQDFVAARDAEVARGATPETDATQAVAESRSTPSIDGLAGQKPRKFAERVQSTQEIDPAIREGLNDPTYIPIANDITLQEADAIIESKGADAAARMVTDETNALVPRVRNVVAQRLIRRHNADAQAARADGDLATAGEAAHKAVDVADKITEWGTRMGQGIQAFAIWNHLDADAALVKAQRTLQKRNKGKPPKNQVKMTPEQAQRITQLANEAKAAPEGFQQNEKIVEMLTEIDKIAGKPTKGDVATSLWYANILSGWSTQMRNVFDTAINAFFDVTANAVANRQNPLRAIGTLLRGTVQRGGPEAAGVMQTGVPTARVDTKIEGATALETNPFTGLLKPLNAWKHVARAMQAEDSLFFKGAQEARAEILARKIAKSEGLRGKELTARVDEVLGRTKKQLAQFEKQAEEEGLKGLRKRRRINELMEQNRPDDLLENSTAFAGRATYNYNPQGVLGIIAKKVGEITRDIPALKLAVPFTRIVANVTNRSLDYTPIGYKRAFLGQTKEMSERTQELRAERIAKATVGTLSMLAVYALDAGGDEDDPKSFQITARGPSDPKVRNQLRELGWKPYSARVGGTYYSYMLTPFAIPFAFIGSVRDAERYKKLDQKDMITRIQVGAVLAGQSILNQSFLSGIADVLDIFGGGGGAGAQTRAMQRFFGRAAGGAIPNLVRQIDRAMDPTVMENRTLLEAVWREIPFARRAGTPKINMLGEPVKSPPSLVISKARGSRVWRLLADKEAWVRIPSRQTKLRIGKEGRYMEPDEYYDYIKMSGQILKKRIDANFNQLEKMDNDRVKKWVDKQTKTARAIAKRRIEQRARTQ